jgi:hypothetical protein
LSQEDVSTKYCQMFDAVSSVVSRNYFQPDLNRKLNLLDQTWMDWFSDYFFFRK